MKKYFLFLTLIVVIPLTSFSVDVEKSKGVPLFKPMVLDRKLMDINSISAWFRNDGEFFSDHSISGPGFEWPKGGGVHAIFSSSMWIGARVQLPTDTTKKEIRVATVGHFGSEFRPGIILPDGTADDFTRAKYRYYRVKPNEDSPAFNPDFAEWPVDQGAPFHDIDGDGTYNPNIDKPALLWGDDVVYPDMMMFAVYNDADETFHTWIWGQSKPLGAEVRQLSWAYNRAGPFGQMIFMRFEVINKSTTAWDSAYLVVWSDPDMGDAFDDYSGVDTTIYDPKTGEKRNLGYCYNGDTQDGPPGYGSTPPAVGYKYFQGPRIYTGEITDTAKWSGNRVVGYKNLNVSGFNFYCNPRQGGCTNPDWYDPSRFTQTWNIMRGLGTTGKPWVCPHTGDTTKFVFAGDPVTGKGWIGPDLIQPSDVRFTLPAGPFRIEPGDTQQVVVGIIVARGSNNLNSITVLRSYADLSQTLFNNNFKLPPAPPSPKVNATWVDGKILLTWDNKAESFVNFDPRFDSTTWKFRAYSVYQTDDPLLRPGAKIENIGIFYDTMGRKNVYDYETFPGVDEPVLAKIWEGNVPGIINQILLKEDRIKLKPFVAGKPYYFIVTATAIAEYKDDDTTKAKMISGLKVLESPKHVITIIPRNPVLGTEFPSGQSYGDVIPHNKWVRKDHYDDAVQVKMIDPWRTENKKYRITFKGDDLNVESWSLFEIDNNGNIIDTVIENNTNFSGNESYPIVSNVMPKVIKQPVGVRRRSQSPSGWKYKGTRWFTGVNGKRMDDSTASIAALRIPARGIVAYPRVGVWNEYESGLRPDSLRQVEIRFSNTNTQKAYRYCTGFSIRPPKPVVQPEFRPFVIDTVGFGYLYQDYEMFVMGDESKGRTVPFTVWEVDSIYGDGIPRQLDVGIVERNDTLYRWIKGSLGQDTLVYRYKGNIDGKWDPSPYTTLNYEEGDEVILIFRSSYTDTAKPQYTIRKRNYGDEFPKLPLMYVVWMRKINASATYKEGDIAYIRPNYPLRADKVFEYEIKVPKIGVAELARQRDEMRKIKVVPNPYYASHTLQRDQFDSYVTFTNLPAQCKIRIFNLAGDMVAAINHDYQGQMDNSSTRWDLKNHAGIPVASGMYIAHIEAEGIGEKILKFAIFIQEERLDVF